MRKLLVLALFFLMWGCGGKNAAVDAPEDDLDEPDRLLFERSIRDLNRNRYQQARLTLQTLINTYPDSEFLPEAKYALAESFYREGTTAMLNQAQAEFKDYITFFPQSDRADDAQLMVAMTHVRQMEKPDRDPTQAQFAETELKRMIEQYPDSELSDEAKQKLRDVQEVLAEGIFKVANHYRLRRSFKAAIDRYKEALEKYPDFSKSPEALYFLAESLRNSENEGESAIYYSRIVTDFPLSERVADAKQRLTELNRPIPEPNPVALARAQQQRDGKGIVGKMLDMFSRRPDIDTQTGAATSRLPEPTEGEQENQGTFSIEGGVVRPSTPEPPKQ